MGGNNNQNLIPLTKRDAKEALEIRRKGQLASNEAKKRRKTIKEDLSIMLETIMNNGKTTQENWMTAIAEKMLKGDVAMASFVRDTIGEKPTEKVEVSKASAETMNEIDDFIEGGNVKRETKESN